ncbi:MAG: thiamine pyrophosphate-binding protein [Holophagaceae bacterium]
MPLQDLKAGRQSGAAIVAAALESAGITHAFGIPGTHNLELYDALERSTVTPVLITDEQSAGFLADGMARSGGPLACANVVPGAGVTHGLSGVAEAFMDGVPLLLLTCGIRTDSTFKYQLHDVDQLAVVRPLVKGTWKPTRGEDIAPAILEAARLARSGCPGPVAVEIPANLYLLSQTYDPDRVKDLLGPPPAPAAPDPEAVKAVARMIAGSGRLLIHAGLGAAEAAGEVLQLAERTGALVSTTFSGKGVFPESHPQWLWPGFSLACPPPLRDLAEAADTILILGARMGEVSTGSYGLALPAASAHVDLDPSVPGANFPVAHAITADARTFLRALLETLPSTMAMPQALRDALAAAHAKVRKEQAEPSGARVSPGALFTALQRRFPDAIFTSDSGNGTFLAAEHLRLDGPRRFLAPTDYSCMGYCLPAAIGAKLAHPERPVVGLAGDGALLMTGLELLTARQVGAPVLVAVLRDRELGQIAAFQRTLTNAAPCSVLPDYDLAALAAVSGTGCRAVDSDGDLEAALDWAQGELEAGRAAVLDVAIDYARKTYFTKGVVKANFGRLPWGERLRMVGRAVARRIF